LYLTNAEILPGIFPEETGHELTNKRFRFCHVDVDVYQSGLDILNWIWPKMVVGGMMVYDDYGFFGCEGITLLVEEQKTMEDRLVIYNLNGHAIVIKLK
jgi:O-methyltransferase